jgi:glycosyltransferase involved in cell wall biosynthesis
VSGAEIALLRLVGAMPAGVECAVACPPGGVLSQRLAEAQIEHLPIPGTSVSFKLNPRWTALGLRDLARSVLAVHRHARAWRADVLHANGTRAGLLATKLRSGRAPVLVVQVHDILPSSRVAEAVRRVLVHSAERIVTVSRAATAAFNTGLSTPTARTLRISIDHERFRPGRYDAASIRRELGVPADAPLLGEIAQITPWKGQLVAIEALALLREKHPCAHLLLIGEVAFVGPAVRYDNVAYERELHQRVRELELESHVHFLGRRDDVPALMAALDLALLPSWHEPFGTVVAEAMASGTVPLVTNEGGPRETVEDGVTGRVLPPRDAELWARTAAELLDDPARMEAMRARATDAVRDLTDEAYALRAIGVYEEALAGRRRAA